jgi:hypothetical protein
MPHHPFRGAAIQQRVGIDADQELVPRQQCPRGEPHRLALVGREMDHPQPRVPARELVEDAARAVLAAIVDRDDLEVRVILQHQVLDRLGDDALVVVAGHQEGHARRRRQVGRVADLAVLDFIVVVVIDGADHPVIRHEQRVIERKPEKYGTREPESVEHLKSVHCCINP